MTLQDFKDKVARDVVRLTGYDNFDQMYRAALNGVEAWANIIEVSDRAAELYAKEREKDAFERGKSAGHKIGHRDCLNKYTNPDFPESYELGYKINS